MYDGVLASNAPIFAAIGDGIELLWSKNSPGLPTNVPPPEVDESMQSLRMLSMGCNVQRHWLIALLYSLPWPPCRENKNLYQYGALWTLLSAPSWLLSTLVQRQATDQSNAATTLLGANKFFRFSPESAGAMTLLEAMSCPTAFLLDADVQADALRLEGRIAPLVNWLQASWMQEPSRPTQDVHAKAKIQDPEF